MDEKIIRKMFFSAAAVFFTSLICVLPPIHAYFTSGETYINEFSLASVEVMKESGIQGYSFENRVMSNKAVKATMSKAPGETVEVEYPLENTGAAGAFVFVKETIPYADIRITENDPSPEMLPWSLKKDEPIFSANVSSNWQLIKTKKDTKNKVYEYIYAYSVSSEPKEVNFGEMIKFMDNAAVAEFYPIQDTEIYDKEKCGENIEGKTYFINVKAYAVQSKHLPVASSLEIWDMMFDGLEG